MQSKLRHKYTRHAAGVVQSAHSSVDVTSAEVRGYMWRLANKNNTVTALHPPLMSQPRSGERKTLNERKDTACTLPEYLWS